MQSDSSILLHLEHVAKHFIHEFKLRFRYSSTKQLSSQIFCEVKNSLLAHLVQFDAPGPLHSEQVLSQYEQLLFSLYKLNKLIIFIIIKYPNGHDVTQLFEIYILSPLHFVHFKTSSLHSRQGSLQS